ncbi:Hypothetical protein FKW44_022548 [Caligus rogercresseyi]|uniref:Uncharacterized protein n=1 Tax=Caligus rogercresseyi TaxID=217165 RepID=A0A7T8GNA0_CALRO|nr:Hypothetical protein FKW44_022548 [Caligus rogercresseyi]
MFLYFGDSLEGVGPFWSQGQTPSPDLRGGTASSLTPPRPTHDRGNAKKKDVVGFTINVGGVEVHPFDEIEFLGVKFDTAFTTVPHHINSLRQQQAGCTHL